MLTQKTLCQHNDVNKSTGQQNGVMSTTQTKKSVTTMISRKSQKKKSVSSRQPQKNTTKNCHHNDANMLKLVYCVTRMTSSVRISDHDPLLPQRPHSQSPVGVTGMRRPLVGHRTLTWTTGSLTCVHSYACVYTRGRGTPMLEFLHNFARATLIVVIFRCRELLLV